MSHLPAIRPETNCTDDTIGPVIAKSFGASAREWQKYSVLKKIEWPAGQESAEEAELNERKRL